MKQICAALIAVLAMTLSLAGQVPDSGSAVVKSIGYVKTDARLDISVNIDGVFVHKAYVLSSPNRLVIDVSPARRLEARPVYDVNAFGIAKIRTGQYKKRVSRVIIDFSGPVPAYDLLKTGSGLMVRILVAPGAMERPAAPVVSPAPVVENKPAEAAKPAEAVKPAVFAPVIESQPAGDIKPAPAAEGEAMPPGFYNTTIGVMLGTHRSPDSRFKEVYGADTSVQFGLNFSRMLVDIQGFQVDLSLEARTLSKTGKATLSGEEAKISLIPLTAAGRLLYQTKYIIPFIGAGGDWYHYKEESVIASTSGWANGYHFQGGVYIVVPGSDRLRVKLYYKYTKVTATANDISVKLGGPEYGVGLSFGFNFLNNAAVVSR